jgi:hypothetical protein
MFPSSLLLSIRIDAHDGINKIMSPRGQVRDMFKLSSAITSTRTILFISGRTALLLHFSLSSTLQLLLFKRLPIPTLHRNCLPSIFSFIHTVQEKRRNNTAKPESKCNLVRQMRSRQVCLLIAQYRRCLYLWCDTRDSFKGRRGVKSRCSD